MSKYAVRQLRRIGAKALGVLGRKGSRSNVEYGASYFGEGRDPSGDRQGQSGYASYDRISSNADIAAYMLWRNLNVKNVLEVGCARGFLVEALRDLGIEAVGCDISDYAIAHASPGARDYLQVENLLEGLSYPDNSFDLVCALEVLEHLEPKDIASVLRELRRVCRGVLYASIPSFGQNVAGHDGHYEGKVKPERVAYYNSLGSSFDGPIPFDDLARDTYGLPVEGHLTIASFNWWTNQFNEAGFHRLVDVERAFYSDISPVGLEKFWNIYLFGVDAMDENLIYRRSPEKSLPELGLCHPLFEHGTSLAQSE
jgi:SAM-dependent methyltransferase